MDDLRKAQVKDELIRLAIGSANPSEMEMVSLTHKVNAHRREVEMCLREIKKHRPKISGLYVIDDVFDFTPEDYAVQFLHHGGFVRLYMEDPTVIQANLNRAKLKQIKWNFWIALVGAICGIASLACQIWDLI